MKIYTGKQSVSWHRPLSQAFTIFATGLFLLLCGCKKNTCCTMPTGTEMVRTQTQCADAWGYGNSSTDTIDKLTNYLSNKGIAISKITLQPTGEQLVCQACTCSKGAVFHVWADSQYIAALNAEGFVLK